MDKPIMKTVLNLSLSGTVFCYTENSVMYRVKFLLDCVNILNAHTG